MRDRWRERGEQRSCDGISWYRSPWLGVQEIGNSGFRFVRIDVLGDSTELQLKEVRAIPRFGIFLIWALSVVMTSG